jgi:hypothetical protein
MSFDFSNAPNSNKRRRFRMAVENLPDTYDRTALNNVIAKVFVAGLDRLDDGTGADHRGTKMTVREVNDDLISAKEYSIPSGVNHNRALGSLLGSIHRARSSHLAAARRLGDAAVDDHVPELQTDELVVALPGDTLQLVHHPATDPFISAPAQCGGRAGRIGDAPVGAAEHRDLDQLVEDQTVRDPTSVAAEGVVTLPRRQEGRELVPDGLDEA